MTNTDTGRRCAVCNKPATTADGIVGADLCNDYTCLVAAWDRAAGTPKASAPNHVRDVARLAYTDREGLGTTEGHNTAAYRKIRQHADSYRDAAVYQRAQERAKTGDKRDRRNASIHRAFARGIEAAGEDIAALLGIPEHEIEAAER